MTRPVPAPRIHNGTFLTFFSESVLVIEMREKSLFHIRHGNGEGSSLFCLWEFRNCVLIYQLFLLSQVKSMLDERDAQVNFQVIEWRL